MASSRSSRSLASFSLAASSRCTLARSSTACRARGAARTRALGRPSPRRAGSRQAATAGSPAAAQTRRERSLARQCRFIVARSLLAAGRQAGASWRPAAQESGGARPPGALLGHVQRLSELCKVVIDGGLLQAAAVRRQPLVQRDGVPLAAPALVSMPAALRCDKSASRHWRALGKPEASLRQA